MCVCLRDRETQRDREIERKEERGICVCVFAISVSTTVPTCQGHIVHVCSVNEQLKDTLVPLQDVL